MYFYVGRRMLRPQLFCCPLPFSGAGLQIGSSFFCPEGAKKVWRSDEVEVSGDDFFFKKKEKNAFAIQTYLAEKRLFCTPMQI